MTNFNPTNLIYLFFLKYPLSKFNSNIFKGHSLESQAFMFHYYINTETNHSWDRLFYVYQDHAEDFDYDMQIAHLVYHCLINEENNITPEGLDYLNTQLNKHHSFSHHLFLFRQKYENNNFLEGTSLAEKKFSSKDDFIPISNPYQF